MVYWRRKWQPTPVFLPGESHGQRSLAGYSSEDHKQLDRTEQQTQHYILINPSKIHPDRQELRSSSHALSGLLQNVKTFRYLKYAP